MTVDKTLEKINKKLKKRVQKDLFYDGMAKARKKGVHEEYIEAVYEVLKTGKDITLAVQSALDDWGL